MVYRALNIPQEKHSFFRAYALNERGLYSIKEEKLRASNLFNKKMATIKQIHGKDVALVNTPVDDEIEADAIVTKNPNLLLGIKTADCVPVLFADFENGVVGAAHAGWRGSLSGILEQTVKIMIKQGAEVEKMVAAIGPCLQKKNFEVREDMFSAFILKNKTYKKYFSAKDRESFLFDSEQFVFDRLKDEGIKNISRSGIDTYERENGFFSYRRDTHFPSGRPKTPNQLSVVCL